MPRPNRICPDGVPQHIVNRGNRRSRIFLSNADYLGFLGALAEAAERTVVRLMAFCLMPNHFHLVLWPWAGSEIPAYMQVVMNAHIRDVQGRHGTGGTGHIYQGRYRNSAIFSPHHFLNVCRYVEANPLSGALTERAELWQWSSLSCDGPAPGINLLAPWPVPRPATWLEQVNRPQHDRVLREIRRQDRAARKAARLPAARQLRLNGRR
jgi:putative transposase